MTFDAGKIRSVFIGEQRRSPREPEAGGVSPVLIVVLLVIVALFVFAVLVGSRGGLSSSGCLPDNEEGRRGLFDRWFGPKLLAPAEMKPTGCALSGNQLTFGGDCRIDVLDLTAPPRSWTEKIRAAFRSDRRRLFLKPVIVPDGVELHLTLNQAPPSEGPTPDPLDAKLKVGKQTDVTFSPDGVRSLALICKPPTPARPCKVSLSPPSRSDEQ